MLRAMADYTVNERALEHARRLIEARQYVPTTRAPERLRKAPPRHTGEPSGLGRGAPIVRANGAP